MFDLRAFKRQFERSVVVDLTDELSSTFELSVWGEAISSESILLAVRITPENIPTIVWPMETRVVISLSDMRNVEWQGLGFDLTPKLHYLLMAHLHMALAFATD